MTEGRVHQRANVLHRNVRAASQQGAGLGAKHQVLRRSQAGILAVSAGLQKPVVKDGALAIATVMTCTLSVDHRVIDGALAAEFIQALKRTIEDPLSLLL